MNDLQIFTNEQFGGMRTLAKGKEILFVGKDVAAALGYKNTKDAIATHVDEEDKCLIQRSEITTFENSITKDIFPIEFVGGDIPNRGLTFINESGVYALIFGSKLPQAKAFKRWITHEVIPSIRKTGGYNVSLVKEKEIEARLNNSRARIASEFRKIAEKTDIPEYKHICQQKAAEVLSGVPLLPMEEAKEITYSATDIGKMLGVSANKIGTLANKHNMKTPQYGKYFYSKSEHSCKEVETFRYYECAVAKFREILEGGDDK